MGRSLRMVAAGAICPGHAMLTRQVVDGTESWDSGLRRKAVTVAIWLLKCHSACSSAMGNEARGDPLARGGTARSGRARLDGCTGGPGVSGSSVPAWVAASLIWTRMQGCVEVGALSGRAFSWAHIAASWCCRTTSAQEACRSASGRGRTDGIRYVGLPSCRRTGGQPAVILVRTAISLVARWTGTMKRRCGCAKAWEA